MRTYEFDLKDGIDTDGKEVENPVNYVLEDLLRDRHESTLFI